MSMEEEYSQQRSQKINDFIAHYNNDTLDQINDFPYLAGQEAKQILNVLSKNKDKIQVANEIILKTGKILPMFSLYFNQYYLYDGNISYQNCMNVYNKFCKDFNNMELMNEILLLFCKIYIKQKNAIIEKSSYIFLYLTYKQFKQFFFISLQLYNKLDTVYKQMNMILLILIDSYKNQLQTKFVLKRRKYFINIIIKMFIIEIDSYYHRIASSFIREKPFLLILDLLISNWNLLQNKYKKILRNKSNEWIYFLKENKNKYLQLADIYLNLINKL